LGFTFNFNRCIFAIALLTASTIYFKISAKGEGMRQKASRTWLYIVVSLILGVGVFVTGRSMLGFKDTSDKVMPLPEPTMREEKKSALEEKDRQIEEMNIHMTQLKEKLENSSKQVEGLRAELEQANKALFSARQRLKVAEQRIELLEARPAQPPRQKPPPVPEKPPVVEIPRRPAEPGTYEILHATALYEKPSESSRKIATIEQRVRVLVVESVGDWLEVRSKHGNPPGYIRRDDAMFVGKAN
jgi:hypothetical protein